MNILPIRKRLSRKKALFTIPLPSDPVSGKVFPISRYASSRRVHGGFRPWKSAGRQSPKHLDAPAFNPNAIGGILPLVRRKWRQDRTGSIMTRICAAGTCGPWQKEAGTLHEPPRSAREPLLVNPLAHPQTNPPARKNPWSTRAETGILLEPGEHGQRGMRLSCRHGRVSRLRPSSLENKYRAPPS